MIKKYYNKLVNENTKKILTNRKAHLILALLLSCLVFGWLGLVVFSIVSLMLVDENKIKSLKQSINNLEKSMQKKSKKAKQFKTRGVFGPVKTAKGPSKTNPQPK